MNIHAPDYSPYIPPSDGEFRVRKVRRGWIVTVYSYKKQEEDPVVEEAIQKLRDVQDSWNAEDAAGAASELLHAKTYGSYGCKHDTLSKAETVFVDAGGLVDYVKDLTR